MKRNTIYHGNCLHVLKTLPDNSIDCCITSPPYWGLRNYGVSDQIGLESTPEEFTKKLVEVFEEVKRVLKPTGSLWLNLGDSYAGSGKGAATHSLTNKYWKQGTNKGTHARTIHSFRSQSIKPKDLVGIPWMVAFALRSAGWYLRMDIIWNKPNPMPESVNDRPTKAHEYIFLLTKSAKYFYDAEAIKTESLNPIDDRGSRLNKKRNPSKLINGIRNSGVFPKANKRSVWTVTTKPFSEAHFATFPEELIEPCILAGTSSEGCCTKCGAPYEREVIKDQESNRIKDGHKPGWAYVSKTSGWNPTCKCNDKKLPAIILDPFSGSGTTLLVAKKKGRDYIGIEINGEYIEMSNKRLYSELGMFS